MKKRFLTYLLYAICGALCALPAVFGKLWVLSWVSFVPVLINELIREKDERRPYLMAWKRGFAFFYTYGLVIFYWFVELYPLDFIGFEPIVALAVVLLAWLGVPILQAVPSAFLSLLLCFFSRKRGSHYIYPFFAAALWVLSEYSHTLTWAGVPWGKLAVGQTANLSNVQSASLLGSYFVAFIIIMVSGFIALAVIYMRNKDTTKKAAAFFICAIVIFSANSIYGSIALATDNENGNTIKVAAIQANISSDEKWDNEEGENELTIHRQLSLDAASEGAELIVWPETALPYRINSSEQLGNYVEEISRDANASIIIGCFESPDSINEIYNVTKYVSPENGLEDTMYAKRRLVPFGEYVPMRSFITAIFPPLAEISMLSYDIMPGTDTNLFDTEYGMIGSLICFDSIYETLAIDSVRDGAELLCISTNDSWFHDSSAVYEHNAHAILRSIENGRYTVRAANTGISSIITNKGEIIDMFPPLVQGYAQGNVQFISENTLYTTVGNLLVYLCAAFVIVVWGAYMIKDMKNGHTHK